MKKALALLLASLMVLSLAACTAPAPAEDTKAEAAEDTEAAEAAEEGEMDRLAQIKAKGVLEVCTEPYFAPNEFIDPSKQGEEQYVGVDMEFAKVIADKIGVELKIVPLEFQAVLAGIAEGKYDLAISALGWKKDREETMLLSKGYYLEENSNEDEAYGFACRPEDIDKYTTPESLKDAVAITQSGSIQEGYFKENIPEYKELKYTSSMVDSYLAVVEKKADVAVVAKETVELWSEANGDVLVTTSYSFPVDTEHGGTRVAACLEGTESLMEIVNEVIDELQTSGKFYEWNETYTEYAKSLGIE